MEEEMEDERGQQEDDNLTNGLPSVVDIPAGEPEEVLTPTEKELLDSEPEKAVEITEPAKSYESVQAMNVYQVRPPYTEKFKGNQIKEIILSVLTETLIGKDYEPGQAKKWTIDIANCINEKVKELQMKRYKHVVQVTIGEMRGAGVKAGVRCLWDAETDSYATEKFISNTIFSVVVVFGVYLY